MDIKPLNSENEKFFNSTESTKKSVRPTGKSDNKIESFLLFDRQEGVSKSYRVDESVRKINISLIDRETGEIIQQLSPMEAVLYVRHLNEAIENMLNEIA
ncbi:MAG: hypothetical protein ACKVQC_10830 [Elusimicrobiota bacterium]